MKRKKPTLTERVAKLERECKRLRATVKAADDRTHLARVDAQGARHHSRTMLDHVERLLREKETLMRVSRAVTVLRPELQR